MAAREAWGAQKCPFCGSPALFMVAQKDEGDDEDGDPVLDKIMYCVNCGHESQWPDTFYLDPVAARLYEREVGGTDLGEVVG